MSVGLHFRHADNSPYPPHRACCQVVDVCVNTHLLDHIARNTRPADDKILVRLHWERCEHLQDEHLSTLSLHSPSDEPATLIDPQVAVAVATNTSAMEEFAAEMLATYKAKLVAICYPALSMIFNHSDKFKHAVFSEDKCSLSELLEGYLSKCMSVEEFDIGFKIIKGPVVPLLPGRICNCLIPEVAIVEGRTHRHVSVKTVGSQTDQMSQNQSTPNIQSVPNSDGKQVTAQIAAFQNELNDQKKWFTAQFEDQRQENMEMKTLLFNISRKVAKNDVGYADVSSRETDINRGMRLTIGSGRNNREIGRTSKERDVDNADINQENQTEQEETEEEYEETDEESTDEDDSEHSIAEGDTEKVRPVDGREHNDVRDDREHKRTRNDTEHNGTRNDTEHNDTRNDTEHNDTRNDTEHNGTRNDTEHNGTRNDTEHNDTRNDTEHNGTRNDTEHNGTRNDTEHNDTRNDTEHNGTRNDTEHNDTRNDTEHNGTRNDTIIVEAAKPKEVKRIACPTTKASEASKQDIVKTFQPDAVERDLRARALAGYTSGSRGRGNSSSQLNAFPGAPGGLAGRTQLGRQGNHRGSENNHSLPSSMDSDDDLFGYQSHRNSRVLSSQLQYSELQTMGLNFDIIYAKTFDRNCPDVTKTRITDQEGGEDRFRLLIDLMIGDSPNKTHLWQTVESVLQEEQRELAYAETALDTVICLDTSGSISDGAFQRVKQCVTEFLNETENITEQHELEENVALVTFGRETRVVHHLSNDYASLRDALDELSPGGPSPMLEGVLLALACMSKGGELTLKGHQKLPPRLIILTDGLPTASLPPSAEDKTGIDKQEQERLSRAFGVLRKRQPEDFFQGQIHFCPVGNHNQSFLLTLAMGCGGSVEDKGGLIPLSNYQKLQKHIADGVEWLRRQYDGKPTKDFPSTLCYSIPMENLSPDEATRVTEALQESMQRAVSLYTNMYIFNNILERHGLPPLGSRVVRGPDWVSDNQDTEGAGTIFNHGVDGEYVHVVWDNSLCNVYRYKTDWHEVEVVQDKPRDPENIDFFVGLDVTRGRDWHVMYGDQDGGVGSKGVIIRESNHQTRVMVRWENGRMFEYRHGENNMFDLTVIKPS